MPYVNTAWRHQAITWTNVDLSSVRSCGICLLLILQEMLKISIPGMSLKLTNSRLQSHLPGANKLTHLSLDHNDNGPE